MKTLVVVRHAKSAWDTGEPDRRRPLARRGERQAPETGAWLAEHLDRIDLAVVSPATRARATWELVAAELASPPPVRIEEQVYAAWDGLLDVVRTLPDQATIVALVGHNPGVETLVAELAGVDVRMPTSAVAVISWDGSWSDAGQSAARLRAHGRPPTDLRD